MGPPGSVSSVQVSSPAGGSGGAQSAEPESCGITFTVIILQCSEEKKVDIIESFILVKTCLCVRTFGLFSDGPLKAA